MTRKNIRGGQKKVLLKTRKKRTKSSAAWLERQINDPYVAAAKAQGWRSRAAFKLLEMEDELKFLRPGQKVVDLGSAPGGWLQVLVAKIKPESTGGRIVGIDYLKMDPVPGTKILELDFTDDSAPELLKSALGSKADIVLSDMAAPTTGHHQTDHLQIMGLVEMAYDFARQILAPNGVFLAKVFQGGTEKELLAVLKKDFTKIKHIKPPASRKESSEMYVVALGFRR